MDNNTELYYAHMESDRNDAVGTYFAARPSLNAPQVSESQEELHIALFRAGFERAYLLLWNRRAQGEGE